MRKICDILNESKNKTAMMNQILVLITVMLGISSEGKGHLLDIVSGAHDRVHSAVHGVANSVLGGLNFNVAGQFGVNGHKQQPPPPQGNEPETVVVVVEEQTNRHGPGYGPPSQNGYGVNMNHNNYGQGSYGRPNQNGYGHNNMFNNRPGYNTNGNYGPPPQDYNERPPFNNYGRPPQYNYGQNNYNRPPMNSYGMPLPNNYGNYYGQNNPMQGYGFQNQNNFGQNDQTTQGHGYQNDNYYGQNDQTTQGNQNNNYGKPTQGNYNKNNNGMSTQGYNQNDDNKDYNSNTELPNKQSQKPEEKPIDQTTKKSDDGPLFVPLNPNEYVYGGDKITVGGPKRDTDNAKPASDDEDFPIDVRFQDEK